MCVIKSRIMIGRTGATRLPSASRTFTAPKAGMVFRHRVDQCEAPFLEQRHQRRADDRLGHRVEAKDRVGGHRRARLLVPPAELGRMHDFAATRDQGG